MTILVQKIMKRIRVIFIVRQLITPLAFSIAACVVLISTISLPHVIQNMPAVIDLKAIAHFFFLAFKHADVIVKGALFLTAVSLVIFCRGIIQSIRFFNKV